MITFPSLGPGQLTIGKGTVKDFTAAVLSVEVSPEKKEGGGTPLLSGEETYDTDATFGTLVVEFYQDFNLDGLVNWTWQNDGKELPFVFLPVTAGTTKVTGHVKVKSAKLGGKVGKANTSAVTFTLVKDMPRMENKG